MDNQSQAYGAVRVKQDRNVIIYLLLTILTCGIYSLFFFHSWAQDVNTVCRGDGRETPGLVKFILLGLVTCGIYSFIWYYSLENRLQDNGPRYGVEVRQSGSTILLWMLVGIFLCGLGPLIGMHIMLSNTNALCAAYNRTHNF